MDKKKKAEEFARIVREKREDCSMEQYYKQGRLTVTKTYTAYTKRGVVKVSIKTDGDIADSIDGLQLDIESALGQQWKT